MAAEQLQQSSQRLICATLILLSRTPSFYKGLRDMPLNFKHPESRTPEYFVVFVENVEEHVTEKDNLKERVVMGRTDCLSSPKFRPNAVQALRTCPLWERTPSHPNFLCIGYCVCFLYLFIVDRYCR